jgi:surfactin synthase thioesterase subunit
MPFAGGNAQAYSEWKNYLDSNIELIPLEYAGHGSRACEALYNNFDQCINDIFMKVCSMNPESYIILGHSMGANVALEVTKKILDHSMVPPQKLVVSGSLPPHVSEQEILHHLCLSEFMNHLYKLGGIPDEIMNDKEFFDYFAPIIFNDVKIFEEYKELRLVAPIQPINVSMAVFSGLEDRDFNNPELNSWSKYTKQYCDFHQFHGDHFFILHKAREVCSAINNIYYKTQEEM